MTPMEAEEALLGAIILDQSTLDAVEAIVSQEDFADPDIGEAFALIAAMRGIGKPLSNRAVLSELALMGARTAGRLDGARLGRIFSNAVASDAKFYAAKVRDNAIRRGLLSLQCVLEGANDATKRSEDVIGEIRNRLDAIESKVPLETVTIGKAAVDLIAELKSPDRPATVFTGLYDLDRTIGGYRPGEMVVVAARPGIGKTALGVQVAEYNARTNCPVLVISLEMQSSELAARMLCQATEFTSRDLRQSRLGSGGIAELEEAAANLGQLPMHVWDLPRANINQVRSIARFAKRKHGVGLIVVDYIGLITAEERSRQPRHEFVADISRTLKQLAKELHVPVFVLCQLNRDASNAAPGLNNLRDSGAIEQDADVVILIHRETNDDGEIVAHHLIVAKHRHGVIGQIPIEFQAEKTRFVSDGPKRHEELDAVFS